MCTVFFLYVFAILYVDTYKKNTLLKEDFK